jgi:phage head maturation protease
MEDFRKSSSEDMAIMDSGSFRGYPVPFLNIDHQRHITLPGAFTSAIPTFLDGGGQVLLDHENKAESIVATAVDAGEDMKGFWIEGVFSSSLRAQEIRRRIAEGFVKKMSSYFHGKATHYNEKQIHSLWNNYGFTPSKRQLELAKRGASVITHVDRISEVSIVAVPANSEANIVAVKSLDGDQKSPALTVAPRIDLAALAQRANLADKFVGR